MRFFFLQKKNLIFNFLCVCVCVRGGGGGGGAEGGCNWF